MDYRHRTLLTASATALIHVSVLAAYHSHYGVASATAVAGTLVMAYYHHTVITDHESVRDQLRDDMGFNDEEMARAAEDIADAAEELYERAYEDGREHGAIEEEDGRDEKAFQ